jgi:hypothetical protein
MSRIELAQEVYFPHDRHVLRLSHFMLATKRMPKPSEVLPRPIVYESLQFKLLKHGGFLARILQ